MIIKQDIDMTTNDKLILDTLHGMRELLAEPSRWTQKVSARDAAGKSRDATDPCATSFCLVGAAQRVSPQGPTGVYYGLVTKHLADTLGRRWGIGLAKYNDTHTHTEVLALLNTAIAALKGTTA